MEHAARRRPLAGLLARREGTVLHQRAIRPDDAPRLPRQTILFRFFGVMPELNNELAGRLSHADDENRMAVVATLGASADEPTITLARYQRPASEAGEIALAVEDAGKGAASVPNCCERWQPTRARPRLHHPHRRSDVR